MDRNNARESLTQVQAAHAASSRPVIPVGLSAISGIAAGVGVALVGQSPSAGWARFVALVGGVVLVGAAFALPTAYRARRGLHGYRGRVRSDNTVFLICAIALLVTGRNATSTLSAIYLGIGTVVAVVYYLLLRGRLGRA